MWSQNNWINLICSDVARYGVRSLPAVLWSGGCFTNRGRRKKIILLSSVLVKLYTFLFKGIQTVGCRVQKQAMRLSSRTTIWSTSILLKYVSNWPGWHQHLFFYEVVVKDHDLVDIKNWCFCLKCFSAINFFQTLVEIIVMYGLNYPLL